MSILPGKVIFLSFHTVDSKLKLHVLINMYRNDNFYSGQKYMMASKFGAKIVNVDWVYKSVEKGSCQDHTKYPVATSCKS